MADEQSFVTDLRAMIARKQVTAVIGSGVSVATTSKSPSWRGLIESAVDRCRELEATESWCGLVLGMLEEGSPDMLLSAAERVESKLGENGGGELARWLRESFENLQPNNADTIEALVALGIPLVTTNYDDLIHKVASRGHVTWTDHRNVTRFVRGDDRRVLHLHGHWDEPESVILGIRSYDRVKENRHTQAVMQALGMTNSLLFVGCGQEGLDDPNWGSFLTWLREVETSAGTEHRHYRLVRESETFPQDGSLYPLVYGPKHDDLVPFLKSLPPKKPKARRKSRGKKAATKTASSVPDSVAAYLQRLKEETQHLTLLGMGRSLQVELPIAEAYVPLTTVLARSMEERKTERFKDGVADFEEDVELSQVFGRAAKLGLRGIVLLGEPGSGKTTGARQLAWRLSSRQSLPEDLGLPAGLTPVLLRFRNLSKEALTLKQGGLKRFLKEGTYCADAADGLENPGTELANGKAGGLLWILDGLDEVANPQARSKVSGWVQSALKNRPDDWFVVTCRFQGYYREGVPLGAKFAEFHVRPLDDDQVTRFVHDWFAAAYAGLLGKGPKGQTRAQADSAELLGILKKPAFQAGHIRELSSNPLLLTILCIVFHQERQLPTRRAELYAHCVRVLLEHWRRERYQSDQGAEPETFDAEAAQSVLARVAWWMHQEQDRTSAPLDEMAAEATKALAAVSAKSGLGADGRAFLERMRNETGILAMAGDGDGKCGFLHLSFQEYLAAEHAAAEGLAKELASRAMESWFREAALLSLRQSRPFCEEFFREMLQAGIAEDHPELASQCLNETLFPTPEPFLEVLQAPKSKRNPKRVAAVLRLLRGREEVIPELEEITRKLAKSKDAEVSSFSREILLRQGVEIPISSSGDGGEWVDPRTGIAYITIPAGEFRMGSDEGDSDEKPIHTVEITQLFRLGKYPVTNSQYAQFLEVVGDDIPQPQQWDNRRFNQPEQPVVGVSWNEAMLFCKWAGGELPTEGQWEYACRAGMETEYSFGDDVDQLDEYAWYGPNSGNQPQPVGSKKPNPWGLHDMHGNAWEWCFDGLRKYKSGSITDPLGSTKASAGRVIRGGSWGDSARFVRAAYRYGYHPGYRSGILGFRCRVQ
jgi:formylglycine-generating enzyme required for sulfatase activity